MATKRPNYAMNHRRRIARGMVPTRRVLVRILIAGLLCLAADRESFLSRAQQRESVTDSSVQPTVPEDDEAPTFASLYGQRGVVSIDATLAESGHRCT